MSMYITGSCRVRAGSAGVRGNGTDFSTYISLGNLFKLTSESTIYSVAGIPNATNLTLNSRYVNTDHETARSENSASANSATKVYSFSLSNTPVIQNSIVITASEKFTDDGAGVLTGDATPAGSGTVDYDSANITITLGTDLTATINVTSSYLSGDILNSMSYQIVKDFTPYYDFPELSSNDTNFNHIYTKAIRLLDSAIYDASIHSAYSASDIVITASQRGYVQTSPDGERWRFSVSNSGTIAATKI